MREIIKNIKDNLVPQEDNKHVKIKFNNINKFKIDYIPGFFDAPDYLDSLPDTEETYEVIHVFNLIQASLQYCFFFGTANKRIDGIDSQWILRELDKVFRQVNIKCTQDIEANLINKFADVLLKSNITLLKSRIETLKDVFDFCNFDLYGKAYNNVQSSIKMLKAIPSFKQDIFFKKGLFAIMMSNRMMPFLIDNNYDYSDSMNKLPVPSDYQIPKMLRHFELIEYSDELSQLIEDDKIIPENSKMELDIRSATIQAVELLAKSNNKSPNTVDAYLFSKRKSCHDKHHLTITTNY